MSPPKQPPARRSTRAAVVNSTADYTDKIINYPSRITHKSPTKKATDDDTKKTSSSRRESPQRKVSKEQQQPPVPRRTTSSRSAKAVAEQRISGKLPVAGASPSLARQGSSRSRTTNKPESKRRTSQKKKDDQASSEKESSDSDASDDGIILDMKKKKKRGRENGSDGDSDDGDKGEKRKKRQTNNRIKKASKKNSDSDEKSEDEAKEDKEEKEEEESSDDDESVAKEGKRTRLSRAAKKAGSSNKPLADKKTKKKLPSETRRPSVRSTSNNDSNNARRQSQSLDRSRRGKKKIIRKNSEDERSVQDEPMKIAEPKQPDSDSDSDSDSESEDELHKGGQEQEAASESEQEDASGGKDGHEVVTKQDSNDVPTAGRKLRQSTRVRKPPAKILEPSSSSESEEEALEIHTPIISNFSKRKSRTGGGAQKKRRKVLAPVSRKKPASGPSKAVRRTSSNQRSSRTTAAARPRRTAQSLRNNRNEHKALPRYSPSDGDDDSLTTQGSLMGSDDEESWYNTPASHASRRAAESAMLHHAHQLAYPWDSLHLGTHLGSAALNEYMRDQMKERIIREGYIPGQSVPQYTAQQCLAMVQSLRVSTVLPPPKSDLHAVVQSNGFQGNTKGDGEDYMEVAVDMEQEPQNDDESGDVQMEDGNTSNQRRTVTNFFYGPKIPFKTLSHVYKTMCKQDVDDGREHRRQAQYMTSDDCVNRLKEMEERIMSLKMQEQRVLQTSRDVGLITGSMSENVEMNRLLGHIPRNFNESDVSDDE